MHARQPTAARALVTEATIHAKDPKVHAQLLGLDAELGASLGVPADEARALAVHPATLRPFAPDLGASTLALAASALHTAGGPLGAVIGMAEEARARPDVDPTIA